MAWVLVAFSAALLLFVCWLVARAFGVSIRERFWLALATAMLQLGVISAILSLAGALTQGPWIAAQATIAAITTATLWRRRKPGATFDYPRDWLSWTFIALITAACLVLAWRQWVTPINRPDELNYHASRAIYWLQYQSLLPFVTHNDRQVAFPFGAELLFFWPILFTRLELFGRMVFWLAHPLATLGVIALARETGMPRRRSLAAGALFAATPVVLEYALCLKNDLWMAVFLIGTAWWVVRAMRTENRAAWHWAMAGLYVALAMNVKTTTLVIVPVVILCAFLVRGRRGKALTSLAVGAVLGLICSGLIITLVGNLRATGHPLASPGLRAVVRPDYSAQQTATHAVRGLLYFADFPILPESWAAAMTRRGQGLITTLGVDQPLPLEDPARGWPGMYTFAVPPLARTFSLGGLLWLACLPVTLAIAVVQLIRHRHITPLGAVTLLSIPTLIAGVFLIRWNGGPGRFILGAYGMGLVVALNLLARHVRPPAIRWAGLGLIALAVIVPIAQQIRQTAAREPWGAYPGTPGFAEAAAVIPAGSTILLVAGQNASDYLLFNAAGGYTNRVVSWGKAPFDPQRLEAMMAEHHTTHLLIQDDRSVYLHWDPSLPTSEMAQYLVHRPTTAELPPPAPHQRLFVIRPQK